MFSCEPGDIYACVADIGWITGHSYVVYGPLSNGVSTVLFESVPTYPNPGIIIFVKRYAYTSTGIFLDRLRENYSYLNNTTKVKTLRNILEVNK